MLKQQLRRHRRPAQPRQRLKRLLSLRTVRAVGGKAEKHGFQPEPVKLLPTQQQTTCRYYSPYSRDFTAVFGR